MGTSLEGRFCRFDIDIHTRLMYIFCRYQAVNNEHLKAFVNRKTCTQFLRYDCYNSVIISQGNMWAYWKDRYGNKVNYWPGGEANGYGCACGLKKSCAGDNFLPL